MIKKANDLTIMERLQADTPPFFKKLRNIGAILTALGAAIVGTIELLPADQEQVYAVVQTVAQYALFLGALLAAVSQTAVDDEKLLASQTIDESRT